MLCNKKTKLNTAIWLTVVALAVLSLPVAATAQEVNDVDFMDDPNLFAELQKPGTVEGTGTYFEVTDSNYIDITFESTEPVHLRLESAPRMVVMEIEDANDANWAEITLGGFEPNTTYYRYQNEYHNLTEFTTNESGSYTYTQDLTERHLVFIQPEPSTIFLSDSGWTKPVGTWDPITKTGTLTQDVSENIQIDSDGIILDGNGFSVIGSGTGNGVYLYQRSNVTITNLTVEGFYNGIYLYNSSGNTLTGNTANSNIYGNGIRLENYSSNNILTGNTANSNIYGAGIYVYYRCHNSTLTSNTVSNNEYGIHLYSSSSTLRDNTVSNNLDWGITLQKSGGSTLTGNTMSSNGSNFYVHGDRPDHFDNNIDTTNTVDGKLIYYVVGAANEVYDSTTVPNAGVFYAINCDNITIRDLMLASNNLAGVYLWSTHNSTIENVSASNNGYGIYLNQSSNNTLSGNNNLNHNLTGICVTGSRLHYSSNNTLTGNTASNNRRGIYLTYSVYNTLGGNDASSNTFQGIDIDYSSDNTLTGNTTNSNNAGIFVHHTSNNNTLTGNTANSNTVGIYVHQSSNNTLGANTTWNNYYGILLRWSSSWNTLTGNTVSTSTRGIQLDYKSNDNQIYNNNFIDNTTQAYVDGGSNNLFNLDRPVGGNYWSNWTSPDADGDGFVDLPYVFTGGQDDLPWTIPNGWLNQPPEAVCQDVTVMADSNCEGVVTPEDVDNGSWDPDGDPITFSLSPEGPYAMGTTAVTLTVTDDQGASSACTATVTVLGAGEGIIQLVAEVMALNLQNGIENSLDAKLDAALHALDDVNANNDAAALNAINAFINAVEAQSGNKIPNEADANALIDIANEIIVGLQNGCY
jgi:parallel beta-helix repeat protein